MTGRLTLAFLLLSLLAASNAQALPDGRAYERVSPADKNGGDVGGPANDAEAAGAFGQSATDGNSIGFASLSSFGDAQSAEFLTYYISARGRDGWSTHAISPPIGTPSRFLEIFPFRFLARDLSAGLLEWAEPALAEGAPPGFRNIYVRAADGTYRVVTGVAPPNLPPNLYRVNFAGASPDLAHVVFEANDALVPGAPAGVRSVYEWDGSALHLVSVLPGPGGIAAPGAGAGDGSDLSVAGVISNDGSRIFWTDGEGQLYVRVNATRTVKLNASRRAVSLGDGAARLLATTPDGSMALFIDATPLTDEPDDNGGLYEYDLEAESLHNLTPHAGGDPGVQGVLGIGDDGSTVYFAATAVLATGASPGAPNLYVSRRGAIDFIAVLDAGDSADWTPGTYEAQTAMATPDGAHLAFLSKASATGYDNTDALSGEPDSEMFVYDAGENRLACASCNPGGGRPIGGASIPIHVSPNYEPRFISDDGGRILFNSDDALVAADGNGHRDVYEYEGGRPRLISTGTSGDISSMVDMSPNGRDVFFTTRSRLVAADRDNGSDLYDARIGGGFPVAPESMPCAGEACRGPLSAPPVFGLAAATLWPGEGSPKPTSKGRAGCRARRTKAGRTVPRKRCKRRRPV
jgi:Tol biopolymer transport system component